MQNLSCLVKVHGFGGNIVATLGVGDDGLSFIWAEMGCQSQLTLDFLEQQNITANAAGNFSVGRQTSKLVNQDGNLFEVITWESKNFRLSRMLVGTKRELMLGKGEMQLFTAITITVNDLPQEGDTNIDDIAF